MGESKPPLFEQTEHLLADEDAETLAAIDRARKSVEVGRLVSADDARRRVESWTTRIRLS